MRPLAICAALIAVPCTLRVPAQIVDVSGGASSAYGAEGGSVGFHGRGMDATIGLGMMNGHLTGGGSIQRAVRGGVMILGQQELNVDLPTDVFDVSHTLVGVGLGIKRQTEISTMTGFMGFSSVETGTPLFRATEVGKRVQYAQWATRIEPTCREMITALSGTHTFGVISVECARSRTFTYAVSAGLSGWSPYFAASTVLKKKKLDLKAEYVLMPEGFQRGSNPMQTTLEPVRENISGQYRPSRSFSFSFAHGNYSTSSATGQNAWSQRSELDSAGAEFQVGKFAMNVTGLHSSFKSEPASVESPVGENKAVSAVVRYTKGRVQWSETLLHSSNANHESTAILSSAASVDVTSHLRVSEGINLTAQGATFSHGGTLLTRFSSFSVDYQFFYVATRPDRPFQQSLIFHAETPLPGGLAVQASNTLSPTGVPLYTFQIGKSFAGKSSRSKSYSADIGESLARGRVEDVNGTGIGRAAVMIGKERIYTDADGYFVYREKHSNSHAFQVLTAEFVAADDFAVVSAPAEIRTGNADLPMVHVVVKKLPAGGNA